MDVEFLGPDGGVPGVDDEELDTRRPPNRRRRLFLGAAGVVTLAAAGVLVAQQAGGEHRAAAASTSPAPVSGLPTLVHSSALPDSGLVPVDSNAPAVLVGDTIVTIAGDSLIWVASRGVPQTQTATLSHPADQYALVADAATHRIWVVLKGAARTEITGDGSRGPGAGFTLGAGADGAAAGAVLLDHVLYVTTDIGVYQMSVTGMSARLTLTGIRGGRSIAVDQSRHRLLLVDLDGAHAQVRAERPGRAASITSARLPFGKGGVQAAGGQIWAGGYGDGASGQPGAVLARLDPKTLRPVAHSPLESHLGPGAIIAAAGTHSLLVRSGGDSRPLWCIDARSGAIVRTWPDVAGAVVIGPDGVQELDAAGAASASLSGPECS